MMRQQLGYIRSFYGSNEKGSMSLVASVAGAFAAVHTTALYFRAREFFLRGASGKASRATEFQCHCNCLGRDESSSASSPADLPSLVLASCLAAVLVCGRIWEKFASRFGRGTESVQTSVGPVLSVVGLPRRVELTARLEALAVDSEDVCRR